MRYQKAWLAGLAVVMCCVLAVGLAGCGGSGGDATVTGETPAPEQPAAEQPAASETQQVGGTAQVGPYSLSVTGVERTAVLDDPADTYEARNAASGKEFVVVAIEVGNTTADNYGFGPVDFKLADSAGATYDAYPTNTPDYIFNMPGPVPGGGSSTTKIAYEVPAGTKGFTLTWAPFVEGAEGPTSAVFEFE